MPLSAFTRAETSSVPLSINHQGQFPVATVSFNLAPGASLGDAVQAIDAVKQDIALPGSDRLISPRRTGRQQAPGGKQHAYHRRSFAHG